MYVIDLIGNEKKANPWKSPSTPTKLERNAESISDFRFQVCFNFGSQLHTCMSCMHVVFAIVRDSKKRYFFWESREFTSPTKFHPTQCPKSPTQIQLKIFVLSLFLSNIPTDQIAPAKSLNSLQSHTFQCQRLLNPLLCAQHHALRCRVLHKERCTCQN